MRIDSHQGAKFCFEWGWELFWLTLTFVETFLRIFIASIRTIKFTVACITNRDTFTVSTLKLTLRAFLLLLLALLKHWKKQKKNNLINRSNEHFHHSIQHLKSSHTSHKRNEDIDNECSHFYRYRKIARGIDI